MTTILPPPPVVAIVVLIPRSEPVRPWREVPYTPRDERATVLPPARKAA